MIDYWDNEEAYDEVAAALKQSLRDAVKLEVKTQIEKLTTENQELKGKLTNLTQLEREATAAKAAAVRESDAARRDAVQTVRKEKLFELLAAIDERLYTVERVSTPREKCDQCDDERHLPYTTPRGRLTYESCECSSRLSRWEPVEAVAHEVSRRNGELTLWWVSVSVHLSRDIDYLSGPRSYKRAEGVAAETVAASPTEFSFKDIAAAQAAADMANALQEGTAKTAHADEVDSADFF